MSSCLSHLATGALATTFAAFITAMISGVFIAFYWELNKHSWKFEKGHAFTTEYGEDDFHWLAVLQVSTFGIGSAMVVALLVVLQFTGLGTAEQIFVALSGFIL